VLDRPWPLGDDRLLFTSRATRGGVAVLAAAIALCGAAAAHPVAGTQRPLAIVVTAGLDHTCALTRAGSVRCWGYNGHDELGDGQGTGASSNLPVSVQGLSSGVTALAAGGRHTCAVQGGTALCWGANYSGALGDGTEDRHAGPVHVVGLSSGVASVAGGIDHSCALTTAGAVKCWGDNEGGEVGDGSLDNRWTPVDVVGLGSGVKAIAAQFLHSCALTEAGRVKWWGRGYGLTPVDVPGVTSGVKAITPTCALTDAGGVKCWSLEGGLHTSDVPGLGTGVLALATSGLHGCALISGGAVRCWGANDHGQLGDGTKTDRAVPVNVVGLRKGVESLGVGTSYSCAVTRAGGIRCWGANGAGELGDGTNRGRRRPGDVVGYGLRASLAIASAPVTVDTHGVARIALRCGAPVACKGTIRLERSRTVLGRRGFSITGGHRLVVPVRLTRAAFTELRRAGRLHAIARARFQQPDDGVTEVVRALTLAAD
jgi:Regulator of chromosome condensation (RCC1) repeat